MTLPGLGELSLDAASVVPFGLGTLPADGRGSQRFLVPDLIALRGLEVMIQGVVHPAAGAAYLTRPCSVRLQ